MTLKTQQVPPEGLTYVPNLPRVIILLLCLWIMTFSVPGLSNLFTGSNLNVMDLYTEYRAEVVPLIIYTYIHIHKSRNFMFTFPFVLRQSDHGILCPLVVMVMWLACLLSAVCLIHRLFDLLPVSPICHFIWWIDHHIPIINRLTKLKLYGLRPS